MISMRRAPRDSRYFTPSWGMILGSILVIAASILIGLIAAVLPTGTSARLAIFVFSSLSLLLAWGYRSQANRIYAPGVYVAGLMTVALSILWPRYIYLHFSGLPSVNPLTLATMASLYLSLLAILYSVAMSNAVNAQIRNTGWVGKLIGIWFVWRLLCCFSGPEPFFSMTGFLKELIYINSFLIFGFILAGIPAGSLWIFRIMLASGLLVSLAGIIEAFTSHNYFVGFASAGEDGDISGNLANIASEKIRGGDYRAQSTFDHPIVFAQFVAALVPLAIYSLWCDKSKFWRIVALVALPAALIAIVKSGSRSGIVSVMLGLGLMGLVIWARALVHGRITRIIAFLSLPFFIGAVGIGYLVFQELLAGRGQHETSSSDVRLLMLKNGITALEDNPILGFGQGLAIVKAGIVNTKGVATIDNYFLSIALDSGYVGLALFVAILLIFSFKALRFAIRTREDKGLFVGACVASVLAIAATFAGLSIINNMTMMWLLITATAPFLIQGRTHIEAEKLQ